MSEEGKCLWRDLPCTCGGAACENIGCATPSACSPVPPLSDARVERAADAKRLDWLLSFAVVEDVGDEQCVPGVRFRIEDMEAELCGPSLEWTPRQFIDAAMSRLAAADAVPVPAGEWTTEPPTKEGR